MERETLQAVSGAVNQSAHSVQLCSDITLGLTAIHLHRIAIRDEKPASTLAILLSMAFFTTTIVKEEQKAWILLDQKEDRNVQKSNQSTWSKTNLETVLIICLFLSDVSGFQHPSFLCLCLGSGDQDSLTMLSVSLLPFCSGTL